MISTCPLHTALKTCADVSNQPTCKTSFLPAKLPSCPRNNSALPRILRMKPTTRLKAFQGQKTYTRLSPMQSWGAKNSALTSRQSHIAFVSSSTQGMRRPSRLRRMRFLERRHRHSQDLANLCWTFSTQFEGRFKEKQFVNVGEA